MEEKLLSWLPSDAGRVEDYYESLRRREYQEPEKALLLAILEAALGCYQKYWSAHDRTGMQRFRDAEHWIMEETDDWLFMWLEGALSKTVGDLTKLKTLSLFHSKAFVLFLLRNRPQALPELALL